MQAGGPPFCNSKGGAAPLLLFKGCALLFVLPESFSVNKIQTNQSFFSHFITTPTAPRPVLRVFHQSSYHRIRMHVVQLLFYFPTAPNIEIIKPSLPKPLLSVLFRKPNPHLTP